MHTFWKQEAHSVLSLSLSPPPPQPQKRIKYKFEGKKIETSRFVWFFFLSKEHYLFLSSVYLKTAISDLCKTNWCNLLGPPL